MMLVDMIIARLIRISGQMRGQNERRLQYAKTWRWDTQTKRWEMGRQI